MQAFAKLTTVVDGEPRIIDRPAADRARSRSSAPGADRDECSSASCELLRGYRRRCRRPTGACCWSSSAASTSPARSSGSAASAPALDRAAARPRRRATRCSCRSRRPRRRCSRLRRPSEYAQHGERVVAGQRLMQAASDIFLGWLHVDGSTARPATSTSASCATGRARADVEQMDAAGMAALRRAVRLDPGPRARPSRRPGRDRRLPGRRTVFDRAILAFTEAYAEQNDRDYRALLDAVESGRVEAATDGAPSAR